MRICRFDDQKVGVVIGDEVADVTRIVERLPMARWPFSRADQFIEILPELLAEMEQLAADAPRKNISDVHLLSPVANPGKIIAAPVNYQLHIDEARADVGINYGTDVKSIDHYGLFLKATSSLVGASDGVVSERPDRRTDHEVELALVIGKGGRNISRDEALSHVAGYMIGLDMSIRGTEDRSYRKSLDTFTVLGPWLVTADEINDPDNLDMQLSIGGEVRQDTNTSNMIFDVRRLITYASEAYMLEPGDVILTGTPEGVGPVEPGDVMDCRLEMIGEMSVAVRAG